MTAAKNQPTFLPDGSAIVILSILATLTIAVGTVFFVTHGIEAPEPQSTTHVEPPPHFCAYSARGADQLDVPESLARTVQERCAPEFALQLPGGQEERVRALCNQISSLRATTILEADGTICVVGTRGR